MVCYEPHTQLYGTSNRPLFHAPRDGTIGFWVGFFWPAVGGQGSWNPHCCAEEQVLRHDHRRPCIRRHELGRQLCYLLQNQETQQRNQPGIFEVQLESPPDLRGYSNLDWKIRWKGQKSVGFMICLLLDSHSNHFRLQTFDYARFDRRN